MNIGVNFYGAKRLMYHDFEGVINKAKAAGIVSAEPCIIFPPKENSKEMKMRRELPEFKEVTGGIWEYDMAQEKLNKIKVMGLKVVSAQFMMGMTPVPEEMIENFQWIKEFVKKNDIKYAVMSLAKNLEISKGYVDVFNQITKELVQDGITFVYHTHEVELIDEEGTTALDYLMEHCPDMKLELDVGWVQFAKKSPLEYMRRYKERIVLLHLKDIIADAGIHNRDNCFPAVGDGIIPLKEILEEVKNCTIDEYGIIIDQDNSFTDILEDIAIGVKNIMKICE